MASRSLAFLLLFCIIFMHAASDNYVGGHGFFHVHAAPNRKMKLQRSSEAWETNKGLYEELRNVPSGPDPLHHNVNPPKKPRLSP